MAYAAPMHSRQDAAEPWVAALKGAGLRVTSARLRTLEALDLAAGPMSHHALAQSLNMAGLDRTTVYRNLVALCRAQLVRRSHGGDRIWRYVLAARGQSHRAAHPHFDCRGCGESHCLSPVDISLHGQAEALAALDGFEVVLRGRCAGCAGRVGTP